MLGLARRDRLVLETCRAAEIPLVLTMGGGYAVPIERTVQGHVQTYRILKSIYN
jgi:acetoin utilization deacetylase AcuC-like enzyme